MVRTCVPTTGAAESGNNSMWATPWQIILIHCLYKNSVRLLNLRIGLLTFILALQGKVAIKHSDGIGNHTFWEALPNVWGGDAIRVSWQIKLFCSSHSCQHWQVHYDASHRVSFSFFCTQADYKQREIKTWNASCGVPSLEIHRYFGRRQSSSAKKFAVLSCAHNPLQATRSSSVPLVSLKKKNKRTVRANRMHVLCLDAGICLCVISNAHVSHVFPFLCPFLFYGFRIDVIPACQEAPAFVLSLKSWWQPLKCRLASLMFT